MSDADILARHPEVKVTRAQLGDLPNGYRVERHFPLAEPQYSIHLSYDQWLKSDGTWGFGQDMTGYRPFTSLDEALVTAERLAREDER